MCGFVGQWREELLASIWTSGLTECHVWIQTLHIDRASNTSGLSLPAQPVDATQALNLSAGVSNCKVSRGRSLS
jgi:hypothetical protein